MARKQWRCYHCDEVFYSDKRAREHFGVEQSAPPACKLSAHEGHLITYIRRLEDELARYRTEDSDIMRSILSLEDDVRRMKRTAEEDGYSKGVMEMRAQGFCIEPAKHC